MDRNPVCIDKESNLSPAQAVSHIYTDRWLPSKRDTHRNKSYQLTYFSHYSKFIITGGGRYRTAGAFLSVCVGECTQQYPVFNHHKQSSYKSSWTLNIKAVIYELFRFNLSMRDLYWNRYVFQEVLHPFISLIWTTNGQDRYILSNLLHFNKLWHA